MISLLPLESVLDLGMTGEALLAADFLPCFMALQTVVDAFQLPMCTRELARRKLRERVGHDTHRKHQRNPKCLHNPHPSAFHQKIQR